MIELVAPKTHTEVPDQAPINVRDHADTCGDCDGHADEVFPRGALTLLC